LRESAQRGGIGFGWRLWPIAEKIASKVWPTARGEQLKVPNGVLVALRNVLGPPANEIFD
jgi:hypothetical protein